MYCKSLNGHDVTIAEILLTDSSGNTLEVTYVKDVILPGSGETVRVNCTFTYDLLPNHSYSVIAISQLDYQSLSQRFTA